MTLTRKISELHVYPVKSCKGWSLETATVGASGLEHDREWMVIEEVGYFISQRQYPKMATITPKLSGDTLILSVPEMGEVIVPMVSRMRKKVIVWESECEAFDQGEEVAVWLSSFLGKNVRLVRMAPDFERKLKEKYRITGNETVAFADSMPLLLTTEASLEDLNSKLETPLRMDRFRPNIVVSGASTFEEDTWKKIQIEGTVFRVSKPCYRCEITTVNQDTGEKGVEPLEALGRYRTGPKGIIFGQLLIHEGQGRIRVGDEVTVLE